MRLASPTFYLCGSLCITLVSGCTSKEKAAPAAKQQTPPRKVHTAQAIIRSMEWTVPVTGTLSPQESSTISTKVAGRIQRLEVDLGSKVTQGQLLAQIEPRDYELRAQQADAALAEARAALGLSLDQEQLNTDPDSITSVKQAKAMLEEATKTQERVRNLTQSRIASASELDSAEAAYKVAQTRYEAAREEARARLAALAQRKAESEIARKALRDTSITAPFEGGIQGRLTSVGEYAAAGSPIVRLVKIDPLRLKLEVPERESMLVKVGQLVRLTVEGDTNRYSGHIARLSPALNESTRVLLAEADVPNPGRLRAGLFARAEIIVQENQESLSVPLRSMVVFAGIEKVVTIREGKALEATITTGRRGTDWAEVVTGIKPGTVVILDPAGIRTGQPVVPASSGEQLQSSLEKPNRTSEN